MTLRENWFATVEGNENLNTDSARRRLATYFVASASYTIDQVLVRLQRVGSPTFDLTCNIRSTTSNRPGSIISSSTTTINAASLATSYADYTFNGLSAALTSGTTYWVELSTSAVGSFSNYVQWAQVSGTYPGYSMTQKAASAGTTWSDQANLTMQFQANSDTASAAQATHVLGVALSSISHINGVAKASIAAINGRTI